MKKRIKVGDMRFPAKVVTIYSIKKTEFDSMYNDKSNKLAYIRLVYS